MTNKKTIYLLLAIFVILNIITINNIAFATSTSSAPSLSNPLGNIRDIPSFIGIIIRGLLGIVGSLSLIMFIYGGFLWMTSGGNEDNVKKGKDTIKWAVLGLVVIFTSYALLNFVLKIISGT